MTARSCGEVTISVVGEIDLCSSLGLQACLAGALDHPCRMTLIADLPGVRFLGAGDDRLRAAHQNARLAVVADSRAVLRALQTADESYGVGVFPTVPAARVGTEAPRRPPARPPH